MFVSFGVGARAALSFARSERIALICGPESLTTDSFVAVKLLGSFFFITRWGLFIVVGFCEARFHANRPRSWAVVGGSVTRVRKLPHTCTLRESGVISDYDRECNYWPCGGTSCAVVSSASPPPPPPSPFLA